MIKSQTGKYCRVFLPFRKIDTISTNAYFYIHFAQNLEQQKNVNCCLN